MPSHAKPSHAKKLPQLSEAEWKIMNAVWHRLQDSGEAVTARDVVDALTGATGWAYTTVKTMMDRLVEKGSLEADRSHKTTRYRPSLSRSAARGEATRSLLARAFGGAAAPLVHFLVQSEPLSNKDREALRRMLAEQESVDDAENSDKRNRDGEVSSNRSETGGRDPGTQS